MKALIIDGQNNHGVFPKTTMMMKDFLEETDLFEVEINRTKYIYQGPHHNKMEGVDSIQQLIEMYPLADKQTYTSTEKPQADPEFKPDFSKYDLVVSNFGWQTADWPEDTKAGFEDFVKRGGGFVLVHAANNAFGDWKEYNQMIGVGGWGGRTTESGPYIYYDKEGQLQVDPSEGPCGSHGPQFEFVIETRAPEHPIMKGLPAQWLHTADELYDRMRGPAENITVLATAFSDKEGNSPPWDKKVSGTDRHEPMLMAVEYGKGRIFHTVLGHMDFSMECVGFMTTFQRGSEWAASGKVTQKVPGDFPKEDATSARPWGK